MIKWYFFINPPDSDFFLKRYKSTVNDGRDLLNGLAAQVDQVIVMEQDMIRENARTAAILPEIPDIPLVQRLKERVSGLFACSGIIVVIVAVVRGADAFAFIAILFCTCVGGTFIEILIIRRAAAATTASTKFSISRRFNLFHCYLLVFVHS